MLPIVWLTTLSFGEEPTQAPEPDRVYLSYTPQANYADHVAVVGPTYPLHVLPLGRDAGQWVALAPGVLRCGAGFCIASGAANENTWLLDGTNVTDPVTGGQRPQRAGPSPRDPLAARGVGPSPVTGVRLPPR